MKTFRCVHCNEFFTSAEEDRRCPRCLRRSTVVRAEGTARQVEVEPKALRRPRFPPRLAGLLAIMGAIPVGWYGWAVAHSGRSSIRIAIIFGPPALVVLGLYGLLVGRPVDHATGKVQRWAAIGFWIAVGLAVVAGTISVFLV
jgi:phage FluMu protein Com